ncbi:hypothetical protein HGP14_07835 [Rhizobium sp. P32RR-XVIII]|uniref:HNH endonuclease n=1 Tax=Rhizobium sp. P32RR-XVIII TaxID=2726738 RepID=UPI001456E512|nr:HNH endonuclease [Rhizobium sp. P32RR-XVIII]NLS03280.1 hypothetical protein [Rhizobium sp. P32RR-XVIII]
MKSNSVGFSQDLLLSTANAFGPFKFSTLDMADKLQMTEPDEWQRVLDQYGEGGKGAGRHFTVISSVSQGLKKLSNRGLLFQRDYEPAPAKHGSPIVRYWSTSEGAVDYFYPDEPHPDETFFEGAVVKIKVNRYERSVKAREACIAHYGAKCVGCGDDLGKKYGDRGSGLVHVHHVRPISEIGAEYEVDPIKDLRPVCPNCHAVIHRGETMLSMDELGEILMSS